MIHQICQITSIYQFNLIFSHIYSLETLSILFLEINLTTSWHTFLLFQTICRRFWVVFSFCPLRYVKLSHSCYKTYYYEILIKVLTFFATPFIQSWNSISNTLKQPYDHTKYKNTSKIVYDHTKYKNTSKIVRSVTVP